MDEDWLNSNDQTAGSNILAELKKELEEATDTNGSIISGARIRFTSNMAELTDENSIIQSQKKKLGMLTKGEAFGSLSRIFGQNNMHGDSDLDSLQLSQVDQYEITSTQKFKGFRFLNYQTATGDEGGAITNYDESATDNDFDLKSLLFPNGTNFNLIRRVDSIPAYSALNSQIATNLNDSEAMKQPAPLQEEQIDLA